MRLTMLAIRSSSSRRPVTGSRAPRSPRITGCNAVSITFTRRNGPRLSRYPPTSPGISNSDNITNNAYQVFLGTTIGNGTVTVQATPTFLSSGDVPLDATSQASFGTGAFGSHRPPPSQYANGVGLSGQYRADWVAVDVGTSPVGFQQQNVLGGIELSPEIGNGVRYLRNQQRANGGWETEAVLGAYEGGSTALTLSV